MSPDFIKAVNVLYEHLPEIKKANNVFDEELITRLESIVDIDLVILINDLKKGSYQGKRKLDISLNINNNSLTEFVSYSGATIHLNNGDFFNISFNLNNSVLELTSHNDIRNYLLNNSDYKLKIKNTEITYEEEIGEQNQLIRFRDADNGTSNISKIILHALSGNYKNQNPAFFWGSTTSGIESLSNRIDIIQSLLDNMGAIEKAEQNANDLRQSIEQVIENKNYINSLKNEGISFWEEGRNLLLLAASLKEDFLLDKYKKPMISFQLDGAFASHYTNATIWENKDVRCGFAISTADIGTSGNMSLSEVRDLQDRGFEIINHGFNHIPNGGITKETAFSDIQQGYESLEDLGLNIKGYVTPNSQLSLDSAKEVLKVNHEYAHTIYNGNSSGANGVYSETDSTTQFDLFRPNMENREIQCKSIIDSLVETNGLTIFYGHEVKNGLDNIIENLIDYAKTNNVEIVSSHTLVQELIRRKKLNTYINKQKIASENLILGSFKSSTSDDVNYTIEESANEITNTIIQGNVGTLITGLLNLDNTFASADKDEFVLSFIINSDVEYTNFILGIRVHKKSDDSIFLTKETESITANDLDLEYKVSTGIFTLTEEFYINIYIRLNDVGGENATIKIKQPYLYKGSKFDRVKRILKVIDNPSMIYFANTTVSPIERTTVKMITKENDLLKVESNLIRIKQSGFYSIISRCRTTLDSDRNGGRLMSSFLINGEGNFCQKDNTAVKDRANFDNSILRYLERNDTLEFNVWTDLEVEQQIDNAMNYNFMEIVKIY